jgi:hypothetical protein
MDCDNVMVFSVRDRVPRPWDRGYVCRCRCVGCQCRVGVRCRIGVWGGLE